MRSRSCTDPRPGSDTLDTKIMFDNIRADMKRYEPLGGWHRSLGFWVTATYRFGHWALHRKNPVTRRVLCSMHSVLATPWVFVRCTGIPKRTRIGAGLCLPHPQNIIIPGDSEIGEGCTVFQEVTLGHGASGGAPKVGDNVVLFAGARVLGNIRVGSNVEVGANAVVVRDVEPGCVVSSPPSRAISRQTVVQFREARVGGADSAGASGASVNGVAAPGPGLGSSPGTTADAHVGPNDSTGSRGNNH